MDEVTRERGEAVEPEGSESRSPEEIKRDIEQTRDELGDTVEALAEKADVKAQAKQRVDELKAKAKAAAPANTQQATEAAKRNPVPVVAVGALVAGFVLGRLTAGD
jgi:ElaB/YqjD/DUF883 family membrane-anchored ribosome-binding protein